MKFKLTGNAEIDQQHAVLDALIDRLELVCERLADEPKPSCQACNAGRRRNCNGSLSRLNDEILSFLVGHVTYEERLMELLPDIVRCQVHIRGHKEAHAEISDRLREVAAHLGREAPWLLGMQLHRIAKDWMGSHASLYDVELAQQIEGIGPAEIEFDSELVAILDELVFHNRPTRTTPLVRSNARRAELQRRLATLTAKQREVCRLAVSGMANKEIAKQLGITINTIKTHRAEIFRKMDVSSLLDLIRAMDIAEPDEL
ncbi:MAG: LuxR C-terminal-related transcriptional regulator [Rhodocyclaceae bacterium]|nr:LuxR C-terminal-related transcriptional regulator [Rhodocyclaceae bacterium]